MFHSYFPFLFLIYGAMAKKPHIIYIIADDVGYNDFSFHGSSEIQTPNIDALGYNGVIFNNLYTQPSCSPSRTALLSGYYPLRTGLQGNPILIEENITLPLNVTLMPEYLNSLGYESHAIGKWHLGYATPKHTPIGKGFKSHFGYWNGAVDYFNYTASYMGVEGFDLHDSLEAAWNYEGKYAINLFTNKALQIIENHAQEKPLFLYLAHLGAHAAGKDILGVPNINRTNTKYSHITNPLRRRYAEIVERIDKSTGEIVQKLSEKNMLKNCIILLISDNGAPSDGESYNSGSNYPLRGIKLTHFEGGIKGTGVLYSPLLEQKSYVNNRLIHLVDFLPTVVKLAGGHIKKSSRLNGINIWKTISNNQPSKRKDIIVDMDEKNNYYSIISEDITDKERPNVKYKLILATFNKVYFGQKGTFHLGKPSENSPEYNISAVLQSTVNIALKKTNRKTLDKAQIIELRSQSTTSCQIPPEKKPLDCRNPGCLFDLTKDPCELNNLIFEKPDIAEKLRMRMNSYWRVLMPQQVRNKTDPIMNPALYNSTYCTYLENGLCGRTYKLWSI